MDETDFILPLSFNRDHPDYAVFDMDGEDVMLFCIHERFGMASHLDIYDVAEALDDFLNGGNTRGMEMYFYGPPGTWFQSPKVQRSVISVPRTAQ